MAQTVGKPLETDFSGGFPTKKNVDKIWLVKASDGFLTTFIDGFRQFHLPTTFWHLSTDFRWFSDE